MSEITKADPLFQMPGYRSQIQLRNVAETWWCHGVGWDDETRKPAMVPERASYTSRKIAKLLGRPEPEPTMREPDWMMGDFFNNPKVIVRFTGGDYVQRYEYETDAEAEAAHDALLSAIRAL